MIETTPSALVVTPSRSLKQPYRAASGLKIRALMHPDLHQNREIRMTELTLFEGRQTPPRTNTTEDVYHVIAGRGRVSVNGDIYVVRVGDTICTPPRALHTIECIGSVALRILHCSTAGTYQPTAAAEPPPLDEDEGELLTPVGGPALFITSGPHALKLRMKLRLTQSAFWRRAYITQSGGTRYETGRSVPWRVLLLLHMAFAPRPDAEAVLEYLRSRYVLPKQPRRFPDLSPHDGPRVAEIRNAMGLTQQRFWSPLGMSQSGGARYELGRQMPDQIVPLLTMFLGTATQAKKALDALRG